MGMVGICPHQLVLEKQVYLSRFLVKNYATIWVLISTSGIFKQISKELFQFS